MTGGAAASAVWQLTGKCPAVVRVDTPIGKTLYLDVIPHEFGVCGIVKDAGDDPDVTHGSEVITRVELSQEDGEITFVGGEGIGLITQDGLKIPAGQPAINPVPSDAGRIRTFEPENLAMTEWGIVVPRRGTVTMFFLAASPPLRMASETSFALP